MALTFLNGNQSFFLSLLFKVKIIGVSVEFRKELFKEKFTINLSECVKL